MLHQLHVFRKHLCLVFSGVLSHRNVRKFKCRICNKCQGGAETSQASSPSACGHQKSWLAPSRWQVWCELRYRILDITVWVWKARSVVQCWLLFMGLFVLCFCKEVYGFYMVTLILVLRKAMQNLPWSKLCLLFPSKSRSRFRLLKVQGEELVSSYVLKLFGLHFQSSFFLVKFCMVGSFLVCS